MVRTGMPKVHHSARLDKTGDHVLCARCASRLAQIVAGLDVDGAPTLRHVYFPPGWQWDADERLWTLTAHARERVQHYRQPLDRKGAGSFNVHAGRIVAVFPVAVACAGGCRLWQALAPDVLRVQAPVLGPTEDAPIGGYAHQPRSGVFVPPALWHFRTSNRRRAADP